MAYPPPSCACLRLDIKRRHVMGQAYHSCTQLARSLEHDVFRLWKQGTSTLRGLCIAQHVRRQFILGQAV